MKKIVAILLATFLLSPVIVVAEPKGGVELTARAQVEVVQRNEKGEDVLKMVDADKANVAPGDTVFYTITYVNNGDQPATNVAINNPVPGEMFYLNNSAEGKGTRIDFSVNKGKSYGPIANLKAITPSGKEKPAKPEDVTNVRWTLEKPLPAGARGSVSYQAKVK